MALGQRGHATLLEAGEPFTHGIAVYSIGRSQLAQRQAPTVAEYGLRPAALPGMFARSGGALQLLNLRSGQRNRRKFHLSKLLPAYF